MTITDQTTPVALITGGSRGIGRATAQLLAANGHAVVVNFRNDEEAAKESVELVQREGGVALAIRADLEDPEAIDAMFTEVRDRFGRLDIFVANAAATTFRPLLETKDRHVERTFAITVTGFLHAVRSAVSLMKDGGAIVAVSGIDSQRVMEGHGILGSAKAALEALVSYLAVELAPRGIRVNGVNPGFIETASARLYAGPEYETKVRDEWISKTPAGRIGRPEEIAEVIAFLTGPAGSFVYGQTIIVDGGRTLGLSSAEG